MGKYIVKRILQVIPMLFILSLIVFMMVRLIPGDPVDMMLGMDIPKDTKEYERERLGLNDPLYIQYFRFVGNARTAIWARRFSPASPSWRNWRSASPRR